MIKATNTKHCSKHTNADASSYCKECKRYMCTECKGFHDNLFGKDHESSIVPSENVINFCSHNDRCKLHPEYHLDMICNDCDCILNYYKHFFLNVIII